MRSRSDNYTPRICECTKTNMMILSYMIQTWSCTLLIVSPHLHVEISHQSAYQRPYSTQHVEPLFWKFIPSLSSKTTFCFCQGSVLGHSYWKNWYIKHYVTCQIQEKLWKRETSKIDHNKEKVFSGLWQVDVAHSVFILFKRRNCSGFRS